MKHALLTLTITSLLATTTFADPIHTAAASGGLVGVQAELDKGVDVNAKDNNGETPLHLAAWIGYKEVAELLIDKGADVNAKDDIGRTPLTNAAQGGHKEIAELLIDAGADVNVKDNRNWTPLLIAARLGQTKIAELLIATGADVNAKGDDGGTPLHYANMQIAELLIAKGANVNVKDDGGKTPLDWAIDFKHTELADLLRKHGGKTVVELVEDRLYSLEKTLSQLQHLIIGEIAGDDGVIDLAAIDRLSHVGKTVNIANMSLTAIDDEWSFDLDAEDYFSLAPINLGTVLTFGLGKELWLNAIELNQPTSGRVKLTGSAILANGDPDEPSIEKLQGVFVIRGKVGWKYEVQYHTGDNDWQVRETVTLQANRQLYIDSSSYDEKRFYRVKLVE